MSKKHLVALLSAIIAFVLYAYYFTDWFKPKQIFIQHSVRRSIPIGGGTARMEKTDTSEAIMSFVLNSNFKLTDVTVVPVAQYTTNKYTHPLWHLVTESNSIPTKGIVYGMRIRGMKPEVKNSEAEPLEPNVTYRIIIEAGKVRGEHDFTPPHPITPVQRARK